MARTKKRAAATAQIDMAIPRLPQIEAKPPAAPAAPPSKMDDLRRQVADVERRSAMPTPGFPVAPERVLDERVRLRDDEPFGRWLLTQKDRGDWIDDLAAAARLDTGFPKNGSPDDVRGRMLKLQIAEADVYEQIDDAERCWLSL